MGVRFTRRHAAFLLAVAIINVIQWGTFIRNLTQGSGHPTSFYVAHTVLIVVNLAIAAGLGYLGWRAWSGRADE